MAVSVRDLVAGIVDPGEGMLPGIQSFPPLDVDQVARDLRLDQRAEKSGRAGQPLPQADGLDMAELDILDHVERLARKAHGIYLAQIDHYEGRIRRAVITADLRVQVEAAASSALADIKAEIIHQQNQLNMLLQAVGSREDEFRQFRQRHGLTRPPRYAAADERTFAILLLLVFVLLESILNGMFFAEGSEAGLKGGEVQALVLSLLNVGVAALYALYGFPYLFHRKRAVRIAGAAATILFLLWLLGLNLALGHYRDLFISGAGSVRLIDLQRRISTAPLLLSDAKSLILVLLGIGLSLASVMVVAARRDRYPGYAAVDARVQRARQRYAEENARCLAGIMALRDRVVDDMTAAVQLIRDSELGMLRAVEGRARAHQNYLNYLHQLSGLHERLVQRYREQNRRVRRDDAPAYYPKPALRALFSEPPALSSLRMEEDVRQDVIARIDHYIRAVNERLEIAMPEYHTVGQLGAIQGVFGDRSPG